MINYRDRKKLRFSKINFFRRPWRRTASRALGYQHVLFENRIYDGSLEVRVGRRLTPKSGEEHAGFGVSSDKFGNPINIRPQKRSTVSFGSKLSNLSLSWRLPRKASLIRSVIHDSTIYAGRTMAENLENPEDKVRDNSISVRRSKQFMRTVTAPARSPRRKFRKSRG